MDVVVVVSYEARSIECNSRSAIGVPGMNIIHLVYKAIKSNTISNMANPRTEILLSIQ